MKTIIEKLKAFMPIIKVIFFTSIVVLIIVELMHLKQTISVKELGQVLQGISWLNIFLIFLVGTLAVFPTTGYDFIVKRKKDWPTLTLEWHPCGGLGKSRKVSSTNDWPICSTISEPIFILLKDCTSTKRNSPRFGKNAMSLLLNPLGCSTPSWAFSYWIPNCLTKKEDPLRRGCS